MAGVKVGKTKVEKVCDEIIKNSATAVLKPLGFRKSALNFYRRHQEVVQVVNFQMSAGSAWNNKLFYINVGLAFDDLCGLTKAEVLEKPKEHECVARGMRARLETLFEDTPSRWSITEDCDSEGISKQLRDVMELLSVELQRIHSVRTYRDHPWFDRARPTGVRAQVLYLLGDLDSARAEVEAICVLFADRKGGKEPQSWINELGLTKLR